MIKYDPDQDQSEKMGWTPVYKEKVPTEQQQDFWGAVSILATLWLAVISLLVDNYPI